MEAFSDGVIAIIITIMVLELKVPRGENFQALAPQGDGPGAMGQSPSVILAIFVSFRHGLDGRKSLRHGTVGLLWCRLADGWCGVLDSAAINHRIAGP